MKATLVFVPPGGGEADYSLDFELLGVPQPGDYISITRPEMTGTVDFIVRRSWWHLDYPSNAPYKSSNDTTCGKMKSIVVECEFAVGPYSSEEHKRSCEAYKNRKGELPEFEATAY
jgi:hypothetical protein